MIQSADRLAKIERWTEWPLTILAFVSIPLLLAPHTLDISENSRAILDGVDYLIWGVFTADLLIRITVAPRRLHYLRTHWLDVLFVALPMLRAFRVARSLRAVRALRATRAVIAFNRVTSGVRKMFSAHGLNYILGTVLLLILVGGSLAVVFERDRADATIKTLPDGLWWAITTTTTVGYGDTYPKTAAGRGVGVAMMVVGITLFSALTANLAAYFVERKEDEVLAEVRLLREQIQRLENLIAEEKTDQ